MKLEWQPAGASSFSLLTPSAPVYPTFEPASGVAVFPTGPSTAVSRKVAVVSGERYRLSASCVGTSAVCAVGVRLHSAIAPRPWSPERRRMQPRIRVMSPCSSITDKAECCAALDADGMPCTPAVSVFPNGAVCEDSDYVAHFLSLIHI